MIGESCRVQPEIGRQESHEFIGRTKDTVELQMSVGRTVLLILFLWSYSLVV